jgi:6-pyruvoyltetrahydropterin/6-carboxytetrahydropterin synthase
MLQVTKIFWFEMAHAIRGYEGLCRHIHGHSYKLYVTVSGMQKGDEYLPSPGFVIDFKKLKEIVNVAVVRNLDHKLVLSRAYLAEMPPVSTQENIFIWDAEPTAENLIIYARKAIRDNLPDGINLVSLKLYETRDSYAEWMDGNQNKPA